ncbi:hypothetical protein AB0L57_19915 [Nocardia sp. NPDC052254]|uniref:hypothetical protein n=1 Tax=Nocardia sp. NPDC052254 TaxID=3155681 RepID=UPI00342E07FC
MDPVRAFLSETSDLAPATRKHKRAAVSACCQWAVRHDQMPANPMGKVDTITVPKSLPRSAPAADIYRVLDALCARWPRKSGPIDTSSWVLTSPSTANLNPRIIGDAACIN